MILSLVTAPTKEPLDLQTVKDHLRIEHSLDDSYLNVLIKAVREYVEKITWRGIIDQTWQLTMNSFPPEDFIKLPKGPLRSVTSVQYLDENNELKTFDAENYELDQQSPCGRLILKYQKTWPATSYRWNAVRVQYVVGFGADEAAVPVPLKQAMLLLIAQMYEHRVPEITGTFVAKIQLSFDALVAPYRLRRF